MYFREVFYFMLLSIGRYVCPLLAVGTAGEVLLTLRLCVSACTVKLCNFSFLHTEKSVSKTNSSAFIALID